MQQIVRSTLSNLVIFEAAARTANFSRAAEELNLTQSAVSHAIRKLEDILGKKLFVRSYPNLKLTAEGEQLHHCAGQCIASTRTALQNIMAKPRAQDAILIAVSTSFARYWLLPRIPRMMTDIPDFRLWIQTVDRDVDLYEEHIDLNIVFGSDVHRQYDKKELWREKVFAVCSPDYYRKHGPFRSLADISKQTLIHYEERVRKRMTWDDWFTKLGVQRRSSGREVLFADHALVLEAAMAGRGVALGWSPIIDDLLATDRLCLASKRYASGPQRFALIAPKGTFVRQPFRQFCNWIEKEMSATPTKANLADAVCIAYQYPSLIGLPCGCVR